MPVPQLPVELIKLIVADPILAKTDLQSLNLTARVFPPLVRPNLYRVLDIPLSWIPKKYEPELSFEQRRAITLRELDRLTSFRHHPNLSALVKEVCLYNIDGPGLEPPPRSIRMSEHDFMQMVYAIFPRLEEASSFLADPPVAPPRLPLPCCHTLHTLRGLVLDSLTWIGLQNCHALRVLRIEEISFRGEVPAIPPSLPFRLRTLEVGSFYDNDTGDVFLQPFLRACGPTLHNLWLNFNYDEVPDLSMLPNLESLSVRMRSDEEVERIGEDLDEWFATALPTCVALERLTIVTESEVGYRLDRTSQGLLAAPEVAAALPATLKRIDFDMLPKEGELEAVLSNKKSVEVISMPPSRQDNYPWLDFCRQRGIKVVKSDWEWPA